MNNNNRIFLLFLLTISMLILSCSKQKDYNADNNFLAYYNTFYSAKKNFDNAVDVVDIITLINLVLYSENDFLQEADLNEDGILSIVDIILLVNIILDN